MSEPVILSNLRTRTDPGSVCFVQSYDRLKELLDLARALEPAEHDELIFLSRLLRESLAAQLEKR